MYYVKFPCLQAAAAKLKADEEEAVQKAYEKALIAATVGGWKPLSFVRYV